MTILDIKTMVSVNKLLTNQERQIELMSIIVNLISPLITPLTLIFRNNNIKSNKFKYLIK